ncbi:MAG TPA: metalloregulator ArsR/SmtB family transcription factor [Candidatus Acidoferrum sp.]|nr:metalloregulator ArsR/SmtB family transcription factor [Candidatus Acidoferrum sp.]
MRRADPFAASEMLDSVPLFAALGDAVRLKLVVRLCEEGSASIRRLTTGTGVTRQAISKHLRVMQDSGLVRSTRRGRERLWQLNQQRLQDARRHLDLISQQWDAGLARLRKFVEE